MTLIRQRSDPKCGEAARARWRRLDSLRERLDKVLDSLKGVAACQYESIQAPVMSKSCHGMLEDYLKCVEESACVKVGWTKPHCVRLLSSTNSVSFVISECCSSTGTLAGEGEKPCRLQQGSGRGGA